MPTPDIRRTPPDDVFEAPGFRMTRYGRFVEMQTHRSPHEQAQLLQAVWESRQETRTRIQRATDELSTLIAKYSSFDLVANLWLRHGLVNADEYKEIESEQRLHFIEHATMLQLRDPVQRITGDLLVSAEDIIRAEALLAEIFNLTMAYYAAEGADPQAGGPPTALDEARYKTLLREMMVGPPAYTHHWMTVLDGLFGTAHMDPYLKEVLGFTWKEALACIDAISGFIGETLLQRARTAQRSSEQMKEQLKQYMATGKFEGAPEHKALLDTIRNMPSKERKRFMSSTPRQWVIVALSHVLRFTASTLASRAGLPEETASTFLDSFSLQLGSTPSDYVIPSPTPDVRTYPIVKMTDGYFCPLPFNLLWAIKPRFEDALKGSKRWNLYQKHRGAFLIAEGLKALERLLPASQSYESLTYPIGLDQKAELDGLVLFDRYAFLLEAKAGDFGAARRGGKAGIKKGLAKLVADPSEQGARAWDYIRKSDAPVLSIRNGEQVAVDKARYTDVAVITLTLDSLDVFTPELHRLRDTGMLGHHDLPWAVCLTDLMAISEILQLPAEFTHFLRWRLNTNVVGDVSAGMDELNWLAVYLKEGPALVQVPEQFTALCFTSYTEDLDAFFLYQGGFRSKPADPPTQMLPTALRELLVGMQAAGIEGFTAPSELLLDLNFEERLQFAEMLLQMRSGRTSFDAPISFEGTAVGVTVFPARQFPQQLRGKSDSISAPIRRKLLVAVEPSTWKISAWLIAPSTG